MPENQLLSFAIGLPLALATIFILPLLLRVVFKIIFGMFINKY